MFHRVRDGPASPRLRARRPPTAFQFDGVVRGAVVEHEFGIRNEGARPLRIERVRMTPPLVATRLPAAIPPGEEGSLRFRLDTATLGAGPFDGEILLSLDDPAEPEAELAFVGRVLPPVDVVPHPAVFVAAQRGEAKAATVEIVNHESAPLHIRGVEHPTDRFTTRLDTIEDGRRYRLTVALKPDGPGGKGRETIVVRTSSGSVPDLPIPANTYLRERVYTFPDAVDLGVLRLADLRARPGLLEQAAQTLMIYQAGGTDLKVRVQSDAPELVASTERGRAGDRWQITVALDRDRLTPGPIRAALTIETNDPEFPRLTVPVTGGIVAP